jgi:hypothetical protein
MFFRVAEFGDRELFPPRFAKRRKAKREETPPLNGVAELEMCEAHERFRRRNGLLPRVWC